MLALHAIRPEVLQLSDVVRGCDVLLVDATLPKPDNKNERPRQWYSLQSLMILVLSYGAHFFVLRALWLF